MIQDNQQSRFTQENKMRGGRREGTVGGVQGETKVAFLKHRWYIYSTHPQPPQLPSHNTTLHSLTYTCLMSPSRSPLSIFKHGSSGGLRLCAVQISGQWRRGRGLGQEEWPMAFGSCRRIQFYRDRPRKRTLLLTGRVEMVEPRHTRRKHCSLKPLAQRYRATPRMLLREKSLLISPKSLMIWWRGNSEWRQTMEPVALNSSVRWVRSASPRGVRG